MTDQELIERILAGDAYAEGIFFGKYEGYFRHMLYKKGIPLYESKEIWQEFFFHIRDDDYKRLRAWRGDGKLRAYLRQVFWRHAINYLRKQVRLVEYIEGMEEAADPNIPFILPAPTPEELLLDKELREKVQVVLQLLSPRDQKILKYRYFHDESYAEVAEHMDMSIDNVGVSIFRALIRFGKKFKERWPDHF